MMNRIFRTLHVWLGLLSGTVLFIVCLTGSLYTFRAQIENGLNYKNLFVDKQNLPAYSLDSLQTEFTRQELRITRITVYPKANRSYEVSYLTQQGSATGFCYVNPYNGTVLAQRKSPLSGVFEVVLAVHKNLLMSNAGKQVVAASVLIFVVLMLSGFVLWLPRKLKGLAAALRIKKAKNTPVKTIDLHKVPGVYSLFLLFIIAVMGLYIAYPWVKSTLLVSLGGNPVLSKATATQKESIKKELAGSFAEILQKKMQQNTLPKDSIPPAIQHIMNQTQERLPYPGITTLVLPNPENPSIHVSKVNRESIFKSVFTDQLEFSSSGKWIGSHLFQDKSPDQKLTAISLPLHTGEIFGWPSLVLYFLASLVGASLPVTGTLSWYRRLKAKAGFAKTSKKTSKKSGKPSTQNPWMIAYGTKSGNSKLVALQLQKQLNNVGVKVKCKNMASLRMSHLEGIERLFAIIGTDGEGDPPASAMPLFKNLHKLEEHSLKGLSIAVCALGDSSYEKFCQAGKDLEQLLISKGSIVFSPRVDCDAEFAPAAKQWIGQVMKQLSLLQNNDTDAAFEVAVNESTIAQIGEINRLTVGESAKPCYHVQLLFDKEVQHILPGDSVELVPQNPVALVNAIAEKMEAENRNELLQFLGQQAELTTLTSNTLKKYQSLANHPMLAKLLASENDLADFLDNANFLDVITEYPAHLTLAQLKQIVPKTRGRLYSVASSTEANAREIHLTVKSIRYNYMERLHEGAGSVYVTETLKQGALVNIKHYKNLEFRLPENENPPVIMIGTGTGIAPFRAFMQHYAHHQQTGKLWLIWGDKNRASDFVYADEIHQYEQDGLLAKTNLAFSRDHDTKIYVQDLMVQEKTLLLEWLRKGAYIYVCGLAKMGEDVKHTLQILLEKYTDEAGSLTFEKLLTEQRYREDIY